MRPAQNGTALLYSGQTYTQFAYNDGDGRTGYDVEAMIKYSDMDPIFHQRDEIFQPPRFAEFEARYFLLNGRGYPDTINTGEITNNTNNYAAQKLNSKITVNRPGGQRTILIRLINLSIQHFTNVEAPGCVLKLPPNAHGFCAVPIQWTAQGREQATTQATMSLPRSWDRGSRSTFRSIRTGRCSRDVLSLFDEIWTS